MFVPHENRQLTIFLLLLWHLTGRRRDCKSTELYSCNKLYSARTQCTSQCNFRWSRKKLCRIIVALTTKCWHLFPYWNIRETCLKHSHAKFNSISVFLSSCLMHMKISSIWARFLVLVPKCMCILRKRNKYYYVPESLIYTFSAHDQRMIWLSYFVIFIR